MSRTSLATLILAASTACVCGQVPSVPPLPPPAVVTACLPNLWALEPLILPDAANGPSQRGGRAAVSVTVDFYGRATLKLVSTSNPVVAKVALLNLKTWKFAQNQPGRIEVVYLVKVAGKPAYGAGNARVELDLPNRVTITVAPSRPEIVRKRPHP